MAKIEQVGNIIEYSRLSNREVFFEPGTLRLVESPVENDLIYTLTFRKSKKFSAKFRFFSKSAGTFNVSINL